ILMLTMPSDETAQPYAQPTRGGVILRTRVVAGENGGAGGGSKVNTMPVIRSALNTILWPAPVTFTTMCCPGNGCYSIRGHVGHSGPFGNQVILGHREIAPSPWTVRVENVCDKLCRM